MNILALTTLYPRPGHETRASFNRQQFEALAKTNRFRLALPVSWLDRLVDWREGTQAPANGVNAEGIETTYLTYVYPPKILRSMYGWFYEASVRRAVEGLVAAERPEVVFACWAHPDGWAAARLGRRLGLPVVIKVVGSDLLVATSDPRRRRRIIEALKASDAIVAVSRHLADRAVALGAEPARTYVVPEGLDHRRFRPGDRTRAREALGLPSSGALLLFVGNLLLSKGVGVLLDACVALRDRGIELHVRIVGAGRDGASLRERCDRLGLGSCVQFVGSVTHATLPTWYQASTLVVLPSDSEGIPNVLREALACGRPFVATKVGGIPEIADPRSSRLVPPRDPRALAEAIEATLSDLPTDDAVVASSRSPSPDESAAQLEAVLQAAAARFALRHVSANLGPTPANPAPPPATVERSLDVPGNHCRA